MTKTEARPEQDRMKWCKGIILGGGVSLLTALFLLLLLAWCISAGAVASGRESGGVAAAAFLAALIGALLAFAVLGLRGIMPGAAVGLLLCFLQLAGGAILTDGPILNGQSLMMACCSIAGGMTAGLLLRRRKGKRRRRRVR